MTKKVGLVDYKKSDNHFATFHTLPELFPGLTVPMVFFPVIAWMTIDPLFNKTPNP